MAKLSVNLIVYSPKEAVYIPFLFDSLKKQTFQDWEMLVIDNASTGETLKLVEENLKALGKPYRILKQEQNIGFASGHNVGFKETNSEYFILQNPDMYLLPDAYEKMVKFLDEHREVSTVSARLMRWDFAKVADVPAGHSDLYEIAKNGFTSQIDAIGIRLLRNRRAVEWLTRETWSKDSENKDVREMYDKKIVEVFGVSGALPMYRKSALEKLLLPGCNIFDPTYHSYKEDLDLAYRMRNAGFTSYVLLDSVAYHDRTGAGPKSLSDFAAIKNKRQQSEYVRFHSYKNHLRTLYKNEYWQNFLLDFPFIFWFELKKFVFLLLTNPAIIFKSWLEIFKNFSYTQSAKKYIHTSRKMYWKGIRRWF